MNPIRHLALVLLTALLLALPLAADAAAPRWESVERGSSWTERVDDDGIDVTVAEGAVYLTTQRAATVKVFTILGQLISQENLAAGTHRLRLRARGIYIIKVGQATRRVTL